jgi:four helix bundle protein
MESARGVGMHKPMSNDIMEHVLQMVELARPIVAAINRRDRDLASQVRRALSSVGLNTAEGLGTRSGNARLRFETALGSLREARAGVRMAVAWGYVTDSAVSALVESLDSLGGRLFGLGRR